MEVQSHDDLACLVLAEGMLYAVRYVGGKPHLRLQWHVGGTAVALYMFQQPLALSLVACRVDVVIHHVKGNEPAAELLVAHQAGEHHEVVGVFRVLYGYQNLLVVASLVY